MKNCNDQLLDAMCPIFFFKRVFYIRLFNAKKLTALKKQNAKNLPPHCFVSTCKIKWTKFSSKIGCTLRLQPYSISLISQYILKI